MRKITFIRQMIGWLLPVCIAAWGMTLLIGPAYVSTYYTAPPRREDPITTLPEAARQGLVPLTPEAQLDLALATVAFLESWQPPDGALTQLAAVMLPPNGAPDSATPLYTARELAHLRDVKVRTDFVRDLAGLTTLPVLAGLLYLLWRPATRPVAFMALGRGGANAQAWLLGLAAIILGGWPFFFYQFHGLFFPAGSWFFAPTDSLMRLFSEFFFLEWTIVWLGSTWVTGVFLALLGFVLAGRVRFNRARQAGGFHVADVAP